MRKGLGGYSAKIKIGRRLRLTKNAIKNGEHKEIEGEDKGGEIG